MKQLNQLFLHHKQIEKLHKQKMNNLEQTFIQQTSNNCQSNMINPQLFPNLRTGYQTLKLTPLDP